MDKQVIKEIIEKYQNGEASAEERAWLMNWYNHYAKTKPREDFPQDILFRQMGTLESILGVQESTTARDSRTGKVIPVSKRPLWIYSGIAAAVLVVILSTIVILSPWKDISSITPSLLKGNDVAPGKSGATLTLANGKKILLSDAENGQLANEAGMVITKTKEGQLVYEIGSDTVQPANDLMVYNTLTTTKGQQFTIVLPDGSTVVLNAASSLKFPVSFAQHKERSVKLTGEGYFEITKNKLSPFVVKTNTQKIKVLGTHFNINSYDDEKATITTLLEGSVLVQPVILNLSKDGITSLRGTKQSIAELQQQYVLKPGEQAINNGRKIQIQQADTELAIAWKENLFKFDEERLEDILAKVVRWYDVTIIYENEKLKDQKFSGSISKFATVSKVLEKLEITGSVHFKIEGRKIIVKQ